MWSIVTTLIVVFQTKFFARNTLNGLFWFFFPMATVVMNDVSAYFCGITMGRKFIKAPFIAMSPNKTWEGFLGAGVLTMIFSFYWPLLLSQWTWFTCPAEDIYISAFPPPLNCEVNSVFTEQMVNIPYFGDTLLRPIQLHGLAYGLFASLVAPFGGFFASAIKRAYNKKDFDAFLPGHGGLMDRMDCQLMILAFTSFHYSTFIQPAPTVSKILSLISLLSIVEQKTLLLELNKIIAASS
jgi:phosphatidate cytidylyltransferase